MDTKKKCKVDNHQKDAYIYSTLHEKYSGNAKKKHDC